jgi:hypothetical protein
LKTSDGIHTANFKRNAISVSKTGGKADRSREWSEEGFSLKFNAVFKQLMLALGG